MTFQEKVKTSLFWRNTFRISLLFFILLVIISLVFNSFSDILKFDTEAVKATNFSEGKWKKFIGTKAAISFLYGIWVTNRNMK